MLNFPALISYDNRYIIFQNNFNFIAYIALFAVLGYKDNLF